MATTAELLKNARNERKKLAEQTSETLINASKERRSLTPAEDHTWSARHADIDRLGKAIENLERQKDLEDKLRGFPPDTRTAGRENVDYRKAPGSPGGPPRTAEHRDYDYTRAMENRGIQVAGMCERPPYVSELSDEVRQDLRNFARGLPTRAPVEYRALGGSTAVGDAMIPQGFVFSLNIALRWYNGLINPDVCTYIDTSMGNLMPYPNMDDTGNSSEITAENAAVTVANAQITTPGDPTFSVVNLNAYLYDSSTVQIPIQLIQDAAFSIEDVLVGDTDINNPRARTGLLAVRVGRKLNADCTNGSGSGQPNGILNAAALGVNAGTPTSISYNNLLDLEHSVDPAYRGGDTYGPKRAKWMFNDSTLKSIKKLTDSNNRPLWIAGGVSEGIQNGRPDSIDGFTYVVNQDMPSIGSSLKSVLFGDLTKYVIRRVRSLDLFIFRERYMTNLQLGFLAYQRYDGQLLTAGNPVKYLVQSPT